MLILIKLGNTFPTFATSDLVKVYTKISTFRQTLAIDFLNHKDDLSIIRVSLEQIFTNTLDKSRISILFKLINWITNFFEQIDNSKPLTNIENEPLVEIDIYDQLRVATFEYFETRKKRTNPEFMDSIGENGGLIHKSSVVGCSDTLAYGKNRVQCLKKYIKLVKRPTIEYIGLDFLEPLIGLLNRAVPVLKNTDIHEFATIFGFTLRGPNIKEELLNKLIAVKSKIPTQLYLELYQTRNAYSLEPDISTVSPENPVSNPVTSLPNLDTTESSSITVPLTNLNTEYERFGFLLNEIRENEDDIKKLTKNINDLEQASGRDRLLKIDRELSALASKIDSKLKDNNIEEDFNAKLLLLTSKLDELDLSDSANVNAVLRSKIEEFEKVLSQMLENNQAKTTTQNNDLMMLKNDINAIKAGLNNAIAMFNDEKNKLQMLLSPLNKLSSDVESMKLKLQTLESTQSQNTNIQSNTRNAHQIISMSLLVDTINNLIIKCEHIKLLLSKPKESNLIPSFLKNEQLKYVYFSHDVPNIFVIDWEYYDDKIDQYLITPIPICDINNCYLFTKKGFGNRTEMFVRSECIRIIENEYFCKKEKQNIKCPLYSTSCELIETIDFQPPKMINETHLSLFTTGRNMILSKELPIFSNILLSFNKDTTFTVNETEFFATEFEQNELIQMVQLKLQNNIWKIDLYKVVYGCLGFGLSSLIIAIVTIIIVKYKKKQTRLVRVNRSRVYFDPSVHETSM